MYCILCVLCSDSVYRVHVFEDTASSDQEQSTDFTFGRKKNVCRKTFPRIACHYNEYISS